MSSFITTLSSKTQYTTFCLPAHFTSQPTSLGALHSPLSWFLFSTSTVVSQLSSIPLIVVGDGISNPAYEDAHPWNAPSPSSQHQPHPLPSIFQVPPSHLFSLSVFINNSCSSPSPKKPSEIYSQLLAWHPRPLHHHQGPALEHSTSPACPAAGTISSAHRHQQHTPPPTSSALQSTAPP
ncbi:uncharacterized protein K444DRAFT_392007 [Hyaloscypha bicolor E]|uniref:Uncharacterized protein n=1 Tax=Hyaloscypha bicolor E TaxID=1095630 RepID=A0A2J6TBI3_9HELO|nr:uncharacterized protein K444DRAFT_392007 [Hyaloscypha bicolor E]PMD60390.1 hypothetical protein K444DRAFT_392007 [Hyaloscypha bicolor E]